VVARALAVGGALRRAVVDGGDAGKSRA